MKPSKEDYIKIQDVCAVIKKVTGHERTRQTVYNWIRHGKRAYSGEVVRLQAAVRFGQMYITREWLLTFLRQL